MSGGPCMQELAGLATDEAHPSYLPHDLLVFFF
jgi:hypothetical protein